MTQQIAKPSGATELSQLLERSKLQIARALPKHLTPERMMRMALTAYSSTPLLQQCNATTIIGCVVKASELGLELTGPLGHAYMVPRRNKKNNNQF
jgi:recombination protein RecT